MYWCLAWKKGPITGWYSPMTPPRRNRWRARRTASPLFPKEKERNAIALDLDPLIQHGHVLELTGKTEVGARVMVNGQEVPVVGGDGSFHYFTPPLPAGESVITITAQNKQGGVNTLQKKVVIQ